jgi:hypothetical protein
MSAQTESFSLKYDGTALSENAIEVGDLAPALMALSDLIQEANVITNQDRGGKITLKIKAIAPGSFNVDILALQTGWDAATDILTGKTATSIFAIMALLGITAKDGLIPLFKALKGKKPKEVKELQNNTIEITGDNNQVTIINNLEYSLYISPTIRKNLYKVLKPLEKEGIETIEFSNEVSETTKVSKSDLGYFQPSPSDDETLQESTRITFVNVSHVWLDNEAGKWKFKEGESTSWNAIVSDQTFLKKLIRGESSISGADTLKVKVKQTQYRTDFGIKSEYEILEVIEHIKGAQQLPLEYNNPSNEP